MKTIENHLDALAQYLPNGKMWESKSIYDSNFRKLLLGFAGELFNAQGYIELLEDEALPDHTTLFLSEWEKALGIPDDCLMVQESNENRRRDIIVKLAKLSVQTADDFVELANLFGIDAVVIPALESIAFPLVFPIPLFDRVSDARFTIHIRIDQKINYFFPYSFPVVFGDENQSIIECLFNHVKPDNTQIIFIGN